MKFPLKLIIAILITLGLMVSICVLFSQVSQMQAIKRYDEIYFKELAEINSTVTMRIKSNTQSDLTEEQKYVEAFKNVDIYSFTDIVILSIDGAVVYSTGDKYKASLINSLSKGDITSFLNEKGSTFTYSGDDSEVLFVFAPYGKFDTHRIMGVLPEDYNSTVTSDSMMYSLLQAFALMLVASLGCGIVVFLFKHRNDKLYTVKPVNNYVLTISGNGKVIATDKRSRAKFEIKDVKECLHNKEQTLQAQLLSGKNMVLDVIAKDGTKLRLMASPVATVGGYKLVCSDMTELVGEYENLKESEIHDPDTNLWNYKKLLKTWDIFVSEKQYYKGLLVVFRVLSKDYYRMLFGELSMKTGTMVYASALREKLEVYGELYSPMEEDALLFINDTAKKEEFLKKLNEISEKINRPIHIGDQIIKFDTRMGVVMLDSVLPSTTLGAALFVGKKAVKIACQSEKMPYYIFRAASFDDTQRDLGTKEGVKELLRSGGVDVWFQPQYNIFDNKIVGMEALCRIVGDRASEITIADFVEAAEETGQIVEMGKYIYEKAMDFAKLLKNENITVAINVSPIQLMQMGFVEGFLAAFRERELSEGAVDIEIIESTLIYSLSEVIAKLNILRKNGINAQIDDFGIAYSSMYYLKKMPVNTLKIDKAFIDGLGNSDADDAIVRNIINMAKDLGLKVIAEGVENDMQVEKLREMGCTVIQGFWIGKAMPKEQAYRLIKEKNSDE